jgi:leucyl/phenylalanyl-tRNA--protein transferase
MIGTSDPERSPEAGWIGWGLQLLASLLLTRRTSAQRLRYLDWPLQRVVLLVLTRRRSEGRPAVGSAVQPEKPDDEPEKPDDEPEKPHDQLGRPHDGLDKPHDAPDLTGSPTFTTRPSPPGPTWWDLLPLDVAPARTAVFFGGVQTAESFVAAFRAGVFPMPPPFDHSRPHLRLLFGLRGLPWLCPDPRTGVPAGSARAEAELRRRMRKYGWTTTMNTRFDEVVAFWITDKHRAVYSELHALGWAHSLEVWDGGDLVGGLFGVLIGGIFYPASLFHTRSNASKVAFVDLDARFTAAGGRLIDCGGFAGYHLTSLGVREISRAEFLATLREVRDDDIRLRTDRLPVARLAPAGAKRN